MTCTINASTSSSAIVQTADGSGVLKVQSNGVTTNALAWVNFNGTTSPGTIRSQYNVSSVTKNGTGDYTVNYANALTDANYAFALSSQGDAAPTPDAAVDIIGVSRRVATSSAITTTSIRIQNSTNALTAVDSQSISAIIFGN